jgi:hypothetical protein
MDLWQRRSVVVGIGICVSVVLVVLAGWSGPASFGQAPDWQTYPDTHAWLVYEGDWQTHQVAAAAGGTLTGTTDPGAALTVRFEGTGVQVVYATGPEGQTFSATIDGHKTTTYSYSDQYSYGNMLPLLDLPPGPHTLTIANGDGALWIEAIQVQGELVAPPDDWTTFQDTDTRLTYGNGAWEAFNVAAANGGTLTGSADPGATLVARFEGTGIRVLYSAGPEGDSFTAQVDDGPVQVAPTQDESYSHGHMLAFEDLAPGEHTLTVTNGVGAIWIEALAIQGTLLDAAASGPEMSLLFTETFDQTMFTGWNVDTGLVGLMLTPREQGKALQVAGFLPPLHLLVGGLNDQEIRADLLIESGAARFSVSRSAAGEYLVEFHATGQIDLYRGDSLLATGDAGTFSPDVWREARIAISGGTVTIGVNDIEYVTIDDPTPPPPGTLSVLPDPVAANSFQLDNLEVWIPSDDMPPSAQATSPAPAPLAEAVAASFDVPFADLINSIGVTSAIAHECISTASPDNAISICINSGAPILEGVPSGYRVTYGSPDWSPDGDLIAVVYSQQWGIEFAYYMAVVDTQGEFFPAGSGAIQVDGITLNDPITDIAWSPDGSKLAFAIKFDNDPFQIYTIDAACRGVCTASQIPIGGGGNLMDPAWSPDGSQLAFSSDASGEWAIYTVGAVGGVPTRVSPADGSYDAPSWAPDGIQLVARYTDGVSTHMRLMDSTPETPLLAIPIPGGTCTGAPDYAPDASSGIVCRSNPLQVVSTTDATYQNLAFSGNDPSWGGRTAEHQQTCPISFSFVRSVREKGNRTGFRLGEVLPDTSYTAYFRTEHENLEPNHSRIWVQIDFDTDRGWVSVWEDNQWVVSQESRECVNELPVYMGDFPAGFDLIDWTERARIEDDEIPDGLEDYLRTEEEALLLARTAIAESETAAERKNRASDLIEVHWIEWIIRMRAFIGQSQFRYDHAGSTTTVNEEILSGAFQVVNDALDRQPSTFSFKEANLQAAFYPKDIFQLEDLWQAYQDAQIIMDAGWSAFDSNILGYDSFFGIVDPAGYAGQRTCKDLIDDQEVSLTINIDQQTNTQVGSHDPPCTLYNSWRLPRSDERYPPEYPLDEYWQSRQYNLPYGAARTWNEQNEYYDLLEADDYFLHECVHGNPAQPGDKTTVFPEPLDIVNACKFRSDGTAYEEPICTEIGWWHVIRPTELLCE